MLGIHQHQLLHPAAPPSMPAAMLLSPSSQSCVAPPMPAPAKEEDDDDDVSMMDTIDIDIAPELLLLAKGLLDQDQPSSNLILESASPSCNGSVVDGPCRDNNNNNQHHHQLMVSSEESTAPSSNGSVASLSLESSSPSPSHHPMTTITTTTTATTTTTTTSSSSSLPRCPPMTTVYSKLKMRKRQVAVLERLEFESRTKRSRAVAPPPPPLATVAVAVAPPPIPTWDKMDAAKMERRYKMMGGRFGESVGKPSGALDFFADVCVIELGCSTTTAMTTMTRPRAAAAAPAAIGGGGSTTTTTSCSASTSSTSSVPVKAPIHHFLNPQEQQFYSISAAMLYSKSKTPILHGFGKSRPRGSLPPPTLTSRPISISASPSHPSSTTTPPSPMPPMPNTNNTNIKQTPYQKRFEKITPINLNNVKQISPSKISVPPPPTTRFEIDTHRWITRFNELIDFHQVHGHCDVPFRYSPNRKLGGWVQKQRDFAKRNKIPQKRLDLLDRIGFSWILEHKKIPKINKEGIHSYDELWEFRYSQLKEFKVETGHCNVPYRYGKDPQLGRWVQNQREFKKRNTLSDERMTRLQELGFMWTMRKAHKKNNEEGAAAPVVESPLAVVQEQQESAIAAAAAAEARIVGIDSVA